MLFARLFIRAGIHGAKSHSGIRTFATNLIEKGFDIKSVSVLLGHNNIQTTVRYIQDNPVKLGEMVAVFTVSDKLIKIRMSFLAFVN